MDEFKHHAIEALQDILDDASEPDGLDIGDILDGSTPLNLSHAGGGNSTKLLRTACIDVLLVTLLLSANQTKLQWCEELV